MPASAHRLAGTSIWFNRVEVLERGVEPRVIPASEVPDGILQRLTSPRAEICGVRLDRSRIMGIVNVTPDSFSDGGLYQSSDTAIAHGKVLAHDGADFLDIGGESTRPGAETVTEADEADRVVPVIRGLTGVAPISIDTRKARVAGDAVAAGAGLINDVSGFEYDAAMAKTTVRLGVPVCIMHAQGTPETMQDDPRYGDVLLEVYDYLAQRIAVAEAAGIARERILVDPGIGFGKTIEHNLRLLRGISLFHALGCAILVGASRKRFIGSLTGAEVAADRVAGSVAVAQAMAAQGVQVLRVHDVAETRQALLVEAAIRGDRDPTA